MVPRPYGTKAGFRQGQWQAPGIRAWGAGFSRAQGLDPHGLSIPSSVGALGAFDLRPGPKDPVPRSRCVAFWRSLPPRRPLPAPLGHRPRCLPSSAEKAHLRVRAQRVPFLCSPPHSSSLPAGPGSGAGNPAAPHRPSSCAPWPALGRVGETPRPPCSGLQPAGVSAAPGQVGSRRWPAWDLQVLGRVWAGPRPGTPGSLAGSLETLSLVTLAKPEQLCPDTASRTLRGSSLLVTLLEPLLNHLSPVIHTMQADIAHGLCQHLELG